MKNEKLKIKNWKKLDKTDLTFHFSLFTFHLL